MDDDTSPLFFGDSSWGWGKWACGRLRDCSWIIVDVLVAGGFFVEIESYAIACLAASVVGQVTRWGLFLMREVHIFWSL